MSRTQLTEEQYRELAEKDFHGLWESFPGKNSFGADTKKIIFTIFLDGWMKGALWGILEIEGRLKSN